MRGVVVALALAHALLAGLTQGASPKAVVIFLGDDFGFYDAGFDEPSEAPAPTLRKLAKQGVTLSRHYTYQFCSPTRSSLMSGRLPIHVHTKNTPTTEPGGVDLRMKTLPELLKEANTPWATHYVGKWHAGGYLEGQTPANRGFDTAFGYLNGMEDHYTQRFNMLKGIDLWHNEGPAYGQNGTYGGYMYSDRAVSAIREHNDTSVPLFLYVAFQNTHVPLQVPEQYVNQAVEPQDRALYYGMTAFMDEAVANITGALREKFAWEDTLVVFAADNGGDITAAGCNYPKRGSKYSDFEGGVATAAFVSGGFVPEAVRGSTTDEMIHVADWWRTIAELAGVSPPAHGLASGFEAAGGDVPPPDSINVWPALSQPGGSSGRSEVPVSAQTLIQGHMKLVTHEKAGTKDRHNSWTPATWPKGSLDPAPACTPCLFNLTADPEERRDLSGEPAFASELSRMQQRLQYWQGTAWESSKAAFSGPFTHCTTNDAFKAAHAGFVGPLCTKPKARADGGRQTDAPLLGAAT